MLIKRQKNNKTISFVNELTKLDTKILLQYTIFR